MFTRQFRASISLDASEYTIEESVRRGSFDSSSAGVHVSGFKRLLPLRQENQSEDSRLGRMHESCQAEGLEGSQTHCATGWQALYF